MAKKVELITHKTKKKDIVKYVPMPISIYRQKQDLSTYKSAVLSAENYLNPNRYPLLQIYVNIVIDSHLTAVWQQRKNLVLSKKFNVVGQDGKVNEEKTKIIQKSWFREFVDLSLESITWGYSLIQFGDIVAGEIKSVELVPRQFVTPEKHIVTEFPGNDVGQDFTTDGYEDWLIGVGKPKDLGLLMKAAPLVMWKNSAFGAWAEFQDKFGTPFRYAKTNIRDEATRQNAQDMMNNWGISPWAVFDKDDVVEMLESAKTDAHNVFDAMINRVNSELSKLVLNQTGTTDEKAYVGSAEVQERVLKAVGEADEYFITSVNNDQLVPFLQKHGILSDGDKIEIAPEDKMNLIDRSKFEVELIKTGKFTVTPEYIKETYGIEVIAVEEDDEEEKGKKFDDDVKNELKKYYS